MNYFEQIVDHINANQTLLRFGKLTVEITEKHVIASHPNGSKCYFSNEPAEATMQLWLNIATVTPEGVQDTGTIEPTAEAAESLARVLLHYDSTGKHHYDHEPMLEVIQLVTKRIRKDYGLLRFGFELKEEVCYSVNAVSPTEVHGIPALLFKPEHQYEPYFYSPYSGRVESLMGDVYGGDPVIMEQLRAQAKTIQQQLQGSVAFTGKNTVRLMPETSGRADVRFANRTIWLQKTPEADGSFTFWTMRGRTVRCQPTKESCAKICKDIGIPERDYPERLVELLQYVQQQNAK